MAITNRANPGCSISLSVRPSIMTMAKMIKVTIAAPSNTSICVFNHASLTTLRITAANMTADPTRHTSRLISSHELVSSSKPNNTKDTIGKVTGMSKVVPNIIKRMITPSKPISSAKIEVDIKTDDPAVKTIAPTKPDGNGDKLRKACMPAGRITRRQNNNTAKRPGRLT